MEAFYTIVVIVALILLILILTFVGMKVSAQESTSSIPFPPHQNTCPDNWKARSITDSNNNESTYCEVPTENMKNVGTILDTSTEDSSKTNAQVTPGYNDTIFEDAPNGVIDFNSPAWLSNGTTAECSQQLWANTHNITWDGITNKSGCE